MDPLRQSGLVAGREYTAQRFAVFGGKHGDQAGGELDSDKALVAGKIDAAWMIDGNHLAFVSDGTLPSGQTSVLTRIAAFDHCDFTVSPQASAAANDAAVRPLLELEGLRQ